MTRAGPHGDGGGRHAVRPHQRAARLVPAQELDRAMWGASPFFGLVARNLAGTCAISERAPGPYAMSGPASRWVLLLPGFHDRTRHLAQHRAEGLCATHQAVQSDNQPGPRQQPPRKAAPMHPPKKVKCITQVG